MTVKSIVGKDIANARPYASRAVLGYLQLCCHFLSLGKFQLNALGAENVGVRLYLLHRKLPPPLPCGHRHRGGNSVARKEYHQRTYAENAPEFL